MLAPMSAKKSFSWLGFLKIVPFMVGLISGILGIIQQIIILYSANPNPVWQEKVFWSGVWIAFVLSSVITWGIEHKKVKNLEEQIEQLYSKLDIEIKDVFMAHIPSDDKNTFLMIAFTVTNQKPENNTIKHRKLFIDGNETVLEKETYVLNDNKEVVKIKSEASDVLLQGIPKQYLVSSKFESKAFDKSFDNLKGKPFILHLTDSYNRIYEKKDEIPEDFIKNSKHIFSSIGALLTM